MCTMLLHSCLHQAQTIHFILKTDKQKGEEEKRTEETKKEVGANAQYRMGTNTMQTHPWVPSFT